MHTVVGSRMMCNPMGLLREYWIWKKKNVSANDEFYAPEK